ncbi:ATP-binding protein [Breznakiella homolactica]|uniref:histidine kinase n=1 Tax=Breznakiella homolactica TaxID=2798577 RepID=A0A7T8B9Q8_9SPIR|nr:ATP-binding protein [Breznakiella homolactica]QQO08732.1 response regulator [Breznakiella homolactica]
MESKKTSLSIRLGQFLTRLGIGMQAKLIMIFLLVQVLPLILLTVMAWQQVHILGDILREIAVEDASDALNRSAVENIERMSTDAANRVAEFLYSRDDDILYLATLEPTLENYRRFSEMQQGAIVKKGEWVLADDGLSWVLQNPPPADSAGGVSTNSENNDMDGFNYRPPEIYPSEKVPFYDEITFVDLDGTERVKYVTPHSTKVRFPLDSRRRDVSRRENTYIKAENYFEKLTALQPGEIYVSDVIGAYAGSNYIGMYTPENVQKAAADRGYDIPYLPEEQAYAGEENPNGRRFEGIVRWATPVTGAGGAVVGYVTFALNHDHIMEFTDHLTPMNERYTRLPSAYDGNYAFIWDYQCRSICHPRHHSIVGYDPETGSPQIPWLESSIYEGWKSSGLEKWTDYAKDIPVFYEQSRAKIPAPELTRAGLVGLDGRYLNNAPQCTGWMDLTGEGGSGSFYILWSGIYKLNTAAAIPYYTGQYAPSEANGFSRRGFGFVAIGSGLEDFTRPAADMEGRLIDAIQENQESTTQRLLFTTIVLIILVVCIAILVASSITGKINTLIAGISHFRGGERQFRFNVPVKDEFGALADSFDDMADSIVASVKNSLSITDMDRRIIYMNGPGLEFCRKTLPEVTGAPYAETSVYPANSPYDPILALEEGREAEIFYLENSDRYLKGIANYLLDKEGRRIGYIIETADMTDMVREQIRIEEQKSLLDKIFSASPDLIWYMDSRGAYFTVNPRFAAIADRPTEEFTGKTAEEILPADIARGFAENDLKAIAGSEPLYSEEHLSFADGHREILDSVRTPIYDGSGSLIGLLGFARNVTIRVEMEEKLRRTQLDLEKAVNDANEANAHKGEFLARMSHEIRTPMNAIIGLTAIVQKKLGELASREGAMDLVADHIDQIESSSQHLLGLLNDILDLSKIEAGRIELTDETVQLSQLAATVANIIRPRCEEKNIHFETTVPDFNPPAFRLDSLRLRQVLINLLGNAVKFTPEHGTIEFKLIKKEHRDGKLLVEFIVRDTGIGIAGEDVGKIFESFEQGGSDIARKHGGTGLGLAISKRILHMFGSEIIVESTPGKGSTFRFEIWLTETQEGLDEKTAEPSVSGKFPGARMLLVDDVEVNRLIVRSLLEDTGIQIDEAADGKEAVDMFAASAPGYYNVILMDVQMPRMDGYEATEAIRVLDRPDAGTVPVIALTANAFKEDIDRAASHGMNDHIAKPVELDALMKALSRFLRGSEEETE